MKNISASLALVSGITLASLMPPAFAVEANPKFMETKGEWTSVMLTLGQDRVFRAATFNEMGDAFRVDVPEARCRTYVLSMGFPLDESPGESESFTGIDVDLRVDRRGIYDATGHLEVRRGDDYAQLEISKPKGEGGGAGFYSDLLAGNTLRIRLKTGPGEEPIFKTFSLSGSAYANERAETLCEEYSRSSPEGRDDPEPYFEEDSRDFFPDDGQRI